MTIIPQITQFLPLYGRDSWYPDLDSPWWLRHNEKTVKRGDGSWLLRIYGDSLEIKHIRSTEEEGTALKAKLYPTADRAYPHAVLGHDRQIALIPDGSIPEQMAYLDRQDPMPRPPYMAGQWWLGDNMIEYMVCWTNPRLVDPEDRFLAYGSTTSERFLGNGYVQSHGHLYKLVALLHGPTPWGRDVLWIDPTFNYRVGTPSEP